MGWGGAANPKDTIYLRFKTADSSFIVSFKLGISLLCFGGDVFLINPFLVRLFETEREKRLRADNV